MGREGTIGELSPAKATMNAFATNIADQWFLGLAVLAWVLPTLYRLVSGVWTTEQGAHGPIIAISGVWLLLAEYRQEQRVGAPGNLSIAVVLIGLCSVAYFLARAIAMLSLETISVVLALIVLVYAVCGARLTLRLWFPLIYLMFLAPLPFFLTAPLIRTLKIWIATHAVDLVSMLGVEAAVSGSALYVDQYELLVEEACAGLNSLMTLTVIGLFYIHIRHRGHRGYGLALAAWIVPLAITANLIRVVILLLLVHFFGSAILDTPFHMLVGLTMALLAMVMLILLDTLFSHAAALGKLLWK